MIYYNIYGWKTSKIIISIIFKQIYLLYKLLYIYNYDIYNYLKYNNIIIYYNILG